MHGFDFVIPSFLATLASFCESTIPNPMSLFSRTWAVSWTWTQTDVNSSDSYQIGTWVIEPHRKIIQVIQMWFFNSDCSALTQMFPQISLRSKQLCTIHLAATRVPSVGAGAHSCCTFSLPRCVCWQCWESGLLAFQRAILEEGEA